MKLSVNQYINQKKLKCKLLLGSKYQLKIFQNNKCVNHMIFNKNNKFMIVILQKSLKEMLSNLNNNVNKFQINHLKFQDHNLIIINNKLRIINKKTV